jgi:hypothetical protein
MDVQLKVLIMSRRDLIDLSMNMIKDILQSKFNPIKNIYV